MIKTHSTMYEINPLTMAIVSENGENGEQVTWIIEEETEFFSKNKPLQIVQRSCKYFGSSLKGRQEGTAAVAGITYKAPIAIDPSIGMYFFPTHSPANLKCSWISHTHIDMVHQVDHKAEIIFKNNKSVLIDASYGSMLNQIQRTAQFRYLMDTRLNQMRKKVDIVAENPPLTPRESALPFFGSQD